MPPRIPGDSSEQEPLLQQAASGTVPDAVPNDGGALASVPPGQRVRTIITCVLILASVDISTNFFGVGMGQLIEGAICQAKYANVEDPYGGDPRCKNEDVQAQLSWITGWEATFAIIPGILTAIPYGFMAEKYGPRIVLVLIFLGDVLAMGGDLLVCLYPSIFDIHCVWLSAMFSVIGGGPVGYAAMTYAVAGNLSSEKQRSTAFFYVAASQILAGLIAGPLTYIAMKKQGPAFTQLIGIGCLVLCLLLSMSLPSMKQATKPDDSGDRQRRTGATILHRMRSSLHDTAVTFKGIFKNNIELGFLLISLVFTTVGGSEESLRLQYTTKRYGWSWAEVGLLKSITAIVNLVLIAMVLPALGQLMLGKLKMSAVCKDTWLARGGLLALLAGSFATGLAPTSALLIVAVAIYELSKGYNPSIISLIISVADGNHQTLIYQCIAIMRCIGALVAGPALAGIYGVGLRLGGGWIGLPFVFAGCLQVFAAVIVFGVRGEKRSVVPDTPG